MKLPLRPSRLALVVLGGALLLLFGRVLFFGETLLDARSLYRFHPFDRFAEELEVEGRHSVDDDPVMQFLPLRMWQAKQWSEGDPGLWCDALFDGVPIVGDPNAGLFNPLNLLYLLLDPIRAWELSIAILLAASFLFMRAFLKARWLTDEAAVLGALIFAFGGLVAVWARHDRYLFVHALIPLVAHWVDVYAADRHRRHLVYAVFAAGLACLGGALQYGAILVVAGTLLLLARRRPLAAVGFALGALVLASPAWVPAREYLATCARDTAADAIFWYPPWHLPTLVAPNLFEDPAGAFGRYFFVYSSQGVFGLVPQARAFLAEGMFSIGAVGFFGLLFAWRRAPGTWLRAYRDLGFALLLLTMIAPLIGVLLPGLTATGFGRLNLLTTFCAAILAAKGLDVFRSFSDAEREVIGARARRFFVKAGAAIATLALVAILAAWIGKRIVPAARVGLAEELPPLREVIGHLFGPAVLVPLGALAAAGWLFFGRKRPAARSRVFVVAILAVAFVEVLVPNVRYNASWPRAWSYPARVDDGELLPPPDQKVLPIGDVFPANVLLAYDRKTALGYLSAWPREYHDALYGEEGGPARWARIDDGRAVDVASIPGRPRLWTRDDRAEAGPSATREDVVEVPRDLTSFGWSLLVSGAFATIALVALLGAGVRRRIQKRRAEP